MNMFSYYITTYLILINKDYNSCRNSHSVYQTYPKWMSNYFPLLLFKVLDNFDQVGGRVTGLCLKKKSLVKWRIY